MHVAFVVANYPPHVGGVETHVHAVAKQLRLLGHGLTVYHLEQVGVRVHDGIPVVGIGRRLMVGDVWAFPERGVVRFLSADFRRRGITHVSTHTRFFPATWAGLLAAQQARLPSLLTEHGGGFVATGSRAVRLAARGVDESLGRWSLRSADAVLVVSERVAHFVGRLSGRHPEVCGNAIDLDLWRAVRPPRTKRKLVYVGRMVREKGWRDFLTVLERQPAGVTGVLAGAGPDSSRVPAEIAARGLASRVRYLGPLAPDHLRAELAGAVYVNPSVAAEGFQTTLLESAAAGARLVTYDVGGAAEVMRAGAIGEVVHSGAIEALTAATTRVLDLDWRWPEGLTAYTWPNIAQRYEQALSHLRRR